jgi:hypothetical protein
LVANFFCKLCALGGASSFASYASFVSAGLGGGLKPLVKPMDDEGKMKAVLDAIAIMEQKRQKEGGGGGSATGSRPPARRPRQWRRQFGFDHQGQPQNQEQQELVEQQKRRQTMLPMVVQDFVLPAGVAKKGIHIGMFLN